MENKRIEQQIEDINQKLDFITAQMEQQQRRQRELMELKDDLTLISKDAMQVVTQELNEVAHHFDSADLLVLLKKLLRNTRNLNKMMDQVESAADLVQDVTPLGKQIVAQLMDTLSEMEAKGYFEFAREFVQIIDTLVTSFSTEDVRLLRENIISIMLTVKNLTQPEVLDTFNNALGFFRKMDVMVEEKAGYWQMMKEIRDPEFKRGVVFMIKFMKNLVEKNGNQLTEKGE